MKSGKSFINQTNATISPKRTIGNITNIKSDRSRASSPLSDQSRPSKFSTTDILGIGTPKRSNQEEEEISEMLDLNNVHLPNLDSPKWSNK